MLFMLFGVEFFGIVWDSMLVVEVFVSVLVVLLEVEG